ncbi:YitT family protein [Neobacillus niacini]|uniref:YczE/YyaS/YitT family protein n=1 Tax=Neobacillus niacini TaxID=86668 RepID=UPI002FFD7887
MRKEWICRWTFFIFGLIVFGLGIALTVEGKSIGIGPWDVFHYGLFLRIGLSIGTWSIIMGFLLLTVSSIATKKLPKIGAFLNMLLIGLFTDFFLWLLPSINSVIGAVIFFTIGAILMGVATGIYMSAELGSGPRDGIMLLIIGKTGWSIQRVRSGMEVLVLILGWALGGPVGIGTVIIAFLLGPVVGISLPQSKKLLKSLIEEKADNKLAV